MAKIVKVSDTKGYRIEPVQIGDQQMVSIRQMYRTQKEPDVWKFGRNGLTINVEVAARIGQHVINMATDENTDFKVLDLDDRESKSAKTKSKPPAKKVAAKTSKKKVARDEYLDGIAKRGKTKASRTHSL
jgi:hypothetical protein